MTERLSVLDSSFLELEKPNLPMHVGGLAVFDPTFSRRMTLERLRELTASRLHLVPRFRQKVLFPPLGLGRPAWADVDLDLDYHLRRVSVPRPGGRRELAELTAQLHERPLDRRMPLWEMYLVDGLQDGYQATITKTHHAMLDGVGGMDVTAILLDHEPTPARSGAPDFRPEPEPSTARLARDAMVDEITGPATAAARLAWGAIRHPASAVRNAVRVVGGVVRLAARGAAPRSPFDRPVGAGRRYAMTEVALDDARAVKRTLGGTVNDVILTTVAGAVGRTLERRGVPTRRRTVRAMMPESLRGDDSTPGQGNQLTTFFVDLPIGPMDPVDRFRHVARTTRTLKSSSQDYAVYALNRLGVFTPPAIHQAVMRFGNAHAPIMNLIASNVPGPQIPLYLDGAPLVAYYPLLPLGARCALSVAVVTLAGVMGFGFTADWDAVPDVGRIAIDARDAFEELRKAAGV